MDISIMRRFFIISLLLFTFPAHAMERAEALYNAGHFDEAATAAMALKTADGFALAARTTLVKIRYFTANDARLPLIADAMAMADKALAINPNHIEGLLQKAIATGYHGRITGSMDDARRSKNLIEQALDIEPENPWALAALGGWHGEVVHRGGSFMAALIFSASNKKSRQFLQQAILLDGTNPAMHLAYAKMLLRSGKSDWQGEAFSHIAKCMDLPPSSAFEAIVHDECALLDAAQKRPEELEILLDPTTTLIPDLAKLWPNAVE